MLTSATVAKKLHWIVALYCGYASHRITILVNQKYCYKQTSVTLILLANS